MAGSSHPPNNGNPEDPRQAALEIGREVQPLIARARAADLGFVAYLLDMVSSETARLARGLGRADEPDSPTDEKSGQ